MAARLTNILGRPVQYFAVTPETVEKSIHAMGMGDWYAEVLGELCKSLLREMGDVITDDIACITGHAARSFDTFAREIFVPGLSIAAG